MKLKEVQVRNFRNFLDSTPVQIQPDVTCLVGKNESGKTAFLHALYRLLPARQNVKFSVPDQYPAWLEKRDRLEGKDLESFVPIRVVFEYEPVDVSAFETKFGPNVLKDATLSLERNYKGTLMYSATPKHDEQVAVRNCIASLKLAKKFSDQTKGVKMFEELKAYAEELAKKKAEDEESGKASERIVSALRSLLGDKDFSDATWETIKPQIPEFFYFHEYSTLPYSVTIGELLQGKPEGLDDGQLTARALLQLAAADDEYLLNPNYERRKRELENVANALTDDVLQYWSQNPELRVQPDITQKTVSHPQGQQSVLDELKIRIWDQRHSLSLPFNEHSTGFQWFFSFLAAFSEYERRKTPVVILLDEPALGLHARAQADFLRFIDERLAAKCQVIYTTHSPFMIQPSKLERVRMVEDKGREHGAKVSQDVLSTDRDTLFPLQGALGYDLVQHLFIAPHNLIVEGTSDYTYMRVISDFLKAQTGRAYLDDRWSLVPVGGIDLIPTFVALLGHHLNVTVIVDSRKGGYQRLNKLSADGILSQQRIIPIGTITGAAAADIEDLFEVNEYLLLFNKAFGKKLKPADIAGSDPITTRIARHLGQDRYDHGVPADLFLRERDKYLEQLSSATFERFQALFSKANETLSK